jgi:hypothetical protein
MPDRQGQLEQFEEQQSAAANPDDNRVPSSRHDDSCILAAV